MPLSEMQKPMISVTFETKIYENDWEYILIGNYLSRMINNCDYNFEKKNLLINNVKDPKRVAKYAQKKVDQGVIDAYYIVEEYITEALKYFQLTPEDLGKGYYYSSAEIVGLYLCKTDFLCHFSSDSILISNHYNWIRESIELFNQNNKILVSNPLWAKIELNKSLLINKSFHFSNAGFSDQCYLLSMKNVKNDFLIYQHPDGDKLYPNYGGELFEKRVFSFMKYNDVFRITALHSYYKHQNFSKKILSKFFHRVTIGQFLHFRFVFWKLFERPIKFFKKLSCVL
jgi:hypothetical protein